MRGHSSIYILHYARFSLSTEMSRLTRDGAVEPVSRAQLHRRERGQGNIYFPCSANHEQVGNLTRLIHTLAICDDHTYIHTYMLGEGSFS